MTEKEQLAWESSEAAGRKKRRHRRVTSGSAFSGAEPRLPGLKQDDAEAALAQAEDKSRDSWLKEQRPPHHYLK